MSRNPDPGPGGSTRATVAQCRAAGRDGERSRFRRRTTAPTVSTRVLAALERRPASTTPRRSVAAKEDRCTRSDGTHSGTTGTSTRNRARSASGRWSGSHPRRIGRGAPARHGDPPGQRRWIAPHPQAADDPWPRGCRRDRRSRWRRRRATARLPVVADLGMASGGYAELALARVESLHVPPAGLDADNALTMIGTGRTTMAILEVAALQTTSWWSPQWREHRHTACPSGWCRRRDDRGSCRQKAEGCAGARARRIGSDRLVPTRLAGRGARRTRRAAGHVGARRRRRPDRPCRAGAARRRRSPGDVRLIVRDAHQAVRRRSIWAGHHRVGCDRGPPRAAPRRPWPAGEQRAPGSSRRSPCARGRPAVRPRGCRRGTPSDPLAFGDGQDRAARPNLDLTPAATRVGLV
jgi:hypothetical protein